MQATLACDDRSRERGAARREVITYSGSNGHGGDHPGRV